jgi:5-methylcytosine-specific restriction endonuclease McrA
MECYRAIQRQTKVTLACEVCDKELVVSPFRSKLIRFCSRGCYGKELGNSMRGEKHPHWRGGKATYFTYGLSEEEWNILRLECFERDSFACQHCGKKQLELHAHHVIPYRISYDNSLVNLLTLCQSCHMKEEWRIDNILYRPLTREDFDRGIKAIKNAKRFKRSGPKIEVIP